LGFRLGFGKALCDNGCYKKCFINTFDWLMRELPELCCWCKLRRA
jgi:hypothetical protein